MFFEILNQGPVGLCARHGLGGRHPASIEFQPHAIRDGPLGLVADRPHSVEKAVRQADLHAFRFDPVIENREQVRERLIGPVGSGSKPKGLLRLRLLLGLLHQVVHVGFQQANEVAGHAQGLRFCGIIRHGRPVRKRA